MISRAFPTTVALALAACSSGPSPQSGSTARPEDLDPDNPGFLRRPFTAEQIRAAMPKGLTLEMRLSTEMAAQRQRWIVLRSDDAGCSIEHAMVNELGRPTETPFVKEYAWVELRDNTTYPAGFTTRERATRDTPLGDLEGWVYRLHDPEAQTWTEFFFADRYPGAPVIVRTTSEGLVVQELTQTARRPPR